MEALQAIGTGVSMPDIGRGLITVLVLVHLQTSIRSSSGSGAKASRLGEYFSTAGFTFLLSCARIWLALVSYYVPEPYLDEVFHIPQAQAYCDGAYQHWDGKITTPPGLYALSVLYHKLWRIAKCTPYSLRSNNVLAILQLALVASLCRNLIEVKLAERKLRSPAQQSVSLYAMHTAFNIALFPVLFFFSALYYTDIVSTLFCLLAYHNHLRRVAPGGVTILNDFWTVVLGVLSLCMRQTNIFWVVVYMGGLEVAHAVKQLSPPLEPTPYITSLDQVARYYGLRYSLGDVHDPPLNYAWLIDWIFCCLSLGVAAISNPLRVLRQVWPHIMMLCLFVAFVAWNGGVVLGDKSNHVATLHLSQMLYIWPFFAFFSAPLFLPSLVGWAGVPLRFLPGPIQQQTAAALESDEQTGERVVAGSSLFKTDKTRRAEAPPPHAGKSLSKADKNRPVKPGAGSAVSRPPKTASLLWLERYLSGLGIYLIYVPITIVLSILVVRFNTLIHPFTLADNRHYMFYVFRYTILRRGWRRYYLVLAYTYCRWMVWGRLAGCSSIWLNNPGSLCPASLEGKNIPYINSPFTRLEELRKPTAETQSANSTAPAGDQHSSQREQSIMLDDPTSSSTLAPLTSTALLWLLATTLSLITAPLVEPRYFILPWVFWRLLVPAWPAHECFDNGGDDNDENDAERALAKIKAMGWLFRLGKKFDVRLVLETLWFVAINIGTMYIFLSRPFYWRAEDGTLLDEGRVQRFMW